MSKQYIKLNPVTLETSEIGRLYEEVTEGSTRTLIAINEYHLKVSSDKLSIVADELDTATITAQIFNYLDEAQNFEDVEILFSVNGLEVVELSVGGIASVPFKTGEPAKYDITATVADYRGGFIKVVATSV